jgi:hypothetical protein
MDYPMALKKIIFKSYSLVNVDRVTLFLVDNAKQEMEIALSKDATGIKIPMGKGIAGYVESSSSKHILSIVVLSTRAPTPGISGGSVYVGDGVIMVRGAGFVTQNHHNTAMVLEYMCSFSIT